MAESIRTFIAAHLSDKVREQIFAFQSDLKRWNADVKWVRPESMHITLKFLGDIFPDQIESITGIMHDVAKLENPFTIHIQGVGCFPNEKRPRVLWLGIQSETDSLVDLANGLNIKLEALGFEPEKRSFKPHLTLGRVKSLKKIENVIESMHEEGFNGTPVLIESIYLMQSYLKSSGAEYKVLKQIQL